MRLTVLGSSGTYTSPGQLCSGYLVRTDTTTVMVDAGNGSSANLQAEVDLAELDAIVISHRHADHCADLIGLHHAVKARGGDAGHIRLYSPPGVAQLIAELTSREAPYVFEDSFELQNVQPGDMFTVGDVRFHLFDSVHPVPTVSMRIEAEGRVLTYSADSAGGPELVRAAEDCDLFLCEATWQGDAMEYPPNIHLTAADAGRVATEARAKRLMLTHIAGHLDRHVSMAEAKETYDGPVELAMDRLTVRV